MGGLGWLSAKSSLCGERVALHRSLQIELIQQPLPLDVQRYRRWLRRLAMEGPGRGREVAFVAQGLYLGHNGQYAAQPLVVGDRAGRPSGSGHGWCRAGKRRSPTIRPGHPGNRPPRCSGGSIPGVPGDLPAGTAHWRTAASGCVTPRLTAPGFPDGVRPQTTIIEPAQTPSSRSWAPGTH